MWKCDGSSVIASVNTQSNTILRHYDFVSIKNPNKVNPTVTEYFLENFRNQGELEFRFNVIFLRSFFYQNVNLKNTILETCVIVFHEKLIEKKSILRSLQEKKIEQMLKAKTIILLVRGKFPRLAVSHFTLIQV